MVRPPIHVLLDDIHLKKMKKYELGISIHNMAPASKTIVSN